MKTIRYSYQRCKNNDRERTPEYLVCLDVPVKVRGPAFSRLDPVLDELVEAVPGVEFCSDSLTYNFRVYVARLFDAEEVMAGVIAAVRIWYARANNVADSEVEMVQAEAAAVA